MKFASFAPWREVAPLRLSEEGYGMELTRHEELRRPAKSSDDMRLEITIPLSNDIVLIGIGKIRHGDNCPMGNQGKAIRRLQSESQVSCLQAYAAAAIRRRVMPEVLLFRICGTTQVGGGSTI